MLGGLLASRLPPRVALSWASTTSRAWAPTSQQGRLTSLRALQRRGSLMPSMLQIVRNLTDKTLIISQINWTVSETTFTFSLRPIEKNLRPSWNRWSLCSRYFHWRRSRTDSYRERPITLRTYLTLRMPLPLWRTLISTKRPSISWLLKITKGLPTSNRRR